ncbi:unnamed protein product [Dovyalis caffra]|uniref:Uncharacterized protein n=1 Tax=Dovyalis caffra TaxID=77055 RepID=A0AAV1QXW1_9ROSI|nr:unnamed protein product [Dovyalis caffra]
MAAPPARARADYDYLIKLLLIGDSGNIDFKIRTIELDGKRIKLQIWDTAGQERFRTITTAYYRGAMGILLVYDVTDESSFNNIRNWIRNIEQHASDNVNKILVGNKADMDESKRAVPTSKGQALADEYGIKFFETSAKTNLNVEEVFFSIARDIKQRISETDSRAEGNSFPPLSFFSNIDVFLLLPCGTSLKQSRLTNQTQQPVAAKLPKSQLAVVHKGRIKIGWRGRLCKWHPLRCQINAGDVVLGAMDNPSLAHISYKMPVVLYCSSEFVILCVHIFECHLIDESFDVEFMLVIAYHAADAAACGWQIAEYVGRSCIECRLRVHQKIE